MAHLEAQGLCKDRGDFKGGRDSLNVLPWSWLKDLLNLFEPQFPHLWARIICFKDYDED